MTKVKKRFIIGGIKNTNGVISYYIEMNPEFIDDIAEMSIRVIGQGNVKIGDIVNQGTTHNFLPDELGSIISQIEQCLRAYEVRKEKW